MPQTDFAQPKIDRSHCHPHLQASGRSHLHTQPPMVFGFIFCTQALDKLSWVNIQDTPPSWVRSHELLQQGILGACADDCAAEACEAALSLDWYTRLMARLHINTFRWEVRSRRLTCSVHC